jgi:hypothetical protein
MTKQFFVACAALAATASMASAQQAKLPAELGVDAGVTIGFDTPRVTTVSIPVPAIRFGFFVNDRVSIEPKLGFQSVHDNAGTSTAFSAQVGALFHFENAPVGRGLYARPFVGLVGEKATGYSETRSVFGAGLGVKEAFADKFASRLEVNYSRMSAVKDEPAVNSLGILFGISVFSR